MQQTQVLSIDALHPASSSLEFAASLLRAGKLVVFPTETVYGLGADALQPDAVRRIFEAKGRPFSDPLIVHIAHASVLDMLVTHIPPEAKLLTHAFWPGPLTLILPAGPLVPKVVTAGLANVAVRMPHHPVALALIHATGSPIAAPSANRFMHVSPTTAQHALADLDGRVPLILDSGACEVGVESTVLDLSGTVPTILRPGGVSLEALQQVLPTVQGPRPHPTHPSTHEQAALQSPGQMPIHYAPSVPALLFEGTGTAMRTAMLAKIQYALKQEQRVGVLIANEDIAAFQASGAALYTLGSEHALEQVAAHLFAGLRTLEEASVQIILCRSFEERGLGLAIHDRLLKATGGNVIKATEL